jgi:hypothetical protein
MPQHIVTGRHTIPFSIEVYLNAGTVYACSFALIGISNFLELPVVAATRFFELIRQG